MLFNSDQNKRSIIIWLTIQCLIKSSINQLDEGSECNMISTGFGICRAINDCSWAMNGIDLYGYVFFDQIREATCSYDLMPIICCPENISTTSTTTTTTTTRPPVTGDSRIPFTPNVGQIVIPFSTSSTTTSTTTTPSTTTSSTTTTTSTTIIPLIETSTKPLRKSAIACDVYNSTSTSALTFHILDGSPTEPGEFPHMVALGFESQELNVDFDFKCGGTLINEKYVLTAAHCVADRDKPVVGRMGRRNIKTNDTDEVAVDRFILKIIMHPLYKKSRKYHDIALIEFNQTVEYTENIRPACLNQDLADVNESVKLSVTGWGSTSVEKGTRSDILLKADLVGVTLGSCNTSILGYNRNDRSLPNGIVDSQFCAYDPQAKKDACQGDSGGPIQIVGLNSLSTIIGVTSFGISCGTVLPSIFTRVAFYLDWIESIVWPV